MLKQTIQIVWMKDMNRRFTEDDPQMVKRTWPDLREMNMKTSVRGHPPEQLK